MNCIRLAKKVESDAIFLKLEELDRIVIPREICEFLKMNSRGIPMKKTMLINDKEYLLSEFMSVDESDNVTILSVASALRGETGMGSFIPFATDGFGNYYGIEFNEGTATAIAFYEAEDGVISFVCNEFREIIQALGLK